MIGSRIALILGGLICLGAALGYFVPRSNSSSIQERFAQTQWGELPVAVDYSESFERILLETESLRLFGEIDVAQTTSIDSLSNDIGTDRIAPPILIGLADLDGERFALFSMEGDEIVRAPKGYTLDSGWVVDVLEDDAVVLVQNGTRVQLSLFGAEDDAD